MTEDQILKYQQQTWQKAADAAWDATMRLTATPQGGRRHKERLEDYVQRVRDLQDQALEQFRYATDELRKAGIMYIPNSEAQHET